VLLTAHSNTFKLNTLLAVHKSYTYALAACVRAAMLWFGGVALFADLMTVGKAVLYIRLVIHQDASMHVHACSAVMLLQ
jgi:hypothetical protein